MLALAACPKPTSSIDVSAGFTLHSVHEEMSSSGPRLTIIIVNWNTRRQLGDCLRSVFAAVCGATEIVVVDNASGDGSAEFVRREYPQVRLIESGGNLGFARGNNLALRDMTSERILLLNPDTVLCEGAIDRLCEALDAVPALGAIGAQLLNLDGSLQHSWGAFPFLARELPLIRRLADKAPEPMPVTINGAEVTLLRVDWAKGACLMLRGAALRQVGLLDEGFWLYTEETDWCYRARALGWEIAAHPDAHVIHAEQSASRQRLGASYVNFAESRVRFVRKHQGRLAAAGVWGVFAARSLFWMLFPTRSYMSQLHSGYVPQDIRRAYGAFFVSTWARVRRPVAPSASSGV